MRLPPGEPAATLYTWDLPAAIRQQGSAKTLHRRESQTQFKRTRKVDFRTAKPETHLLGKCGVPKNADGAKAQDELPLPRRRPSANDGVAGAVGVVGSTCDFSKSCLEGSGVEVVASFVIRVDISSCEILHLGVLCSRRECSFQSWPSSGCKSLHPTPHSKWKLLRNCPP